MIDERMANILLERARRYGKPIETRTPDTSLGTFVGYRVGEVQLALPSHIVHEFALLTHWTPFGGRKHLIGLTHVRGDVMALIDLMETITGRASGKCPWMVVMQGRGGRIAAPVSNILGIRNVEVGELLPQDQSPISSPLVMATTNDLWFLLDEQKLESVFEGLPVHAGSES